MFPEGTFTEEHTTADMLRDIADDLMKVRVGLARRAHQVGRRRSLVSLLDEEASEPDYQKAVLRTDAEFLDLDRQAAERRPRQPRR